MYDRYTQGGHKQRNRGYIKVAPALAKRRSESGPRPSAALEEDRASETRGGRKHRRVVGDEEVLVRETGSPNALWSRLIAPVADRPNTSSYWAARTGQRQCRLGS